MKLLPLLSVALFALPVSAQDPASGAKSTTQDQGVAADQAENMFLKAFYLERGPGRRSAEAIELYKKFLDTAPSSKYAGEAARNTINLLNRGGAKTEDVDAFKTKYAAIVKNLDLSQPADAGAEPGQRGRGQGGQGGQGQRGPSVDEIKAQLEKAKADKNEAEITRLTAELKAAEERQARRGQGGGQGGAGGRRGMGAMTKPITEMNEEELGQFEQMSQFFDRRITQMRDNGQAENADKAQAAYKKMKDALTAGKKEEAEAARLELTKLLPPMRRGGGI